MAVALLEPFAMHSPGALPQRVSGILLFGCAVLLGSPPLRLTQLLSAWSWLEVLWQKDGGDLRSGDWLEDVSQERWAFSSSFLPSLFPSWPPWGEQPLWYPLPWYSASPWTQSNGLTSALNIQNSDTCRQAYKLTFLQAFFSLRSLFTVTQGCLKQLGLGPDGTKEESEFDQNSDAWSMDKPSRHNGFL